MNENVTRLSRRQFLIKLGAASAVITVAGAGISGLLNTGTTPAPSAVGIPGSNATEAVGSAPTTFPNASDPVKPAPGTRAEMTPVADFYRIDIAAIPPSIDGASWTLPITGLVEHPLNLTMADIQKYKPLSMYITQGCISNYVGGDLISTQYWTGASFRDILADAKPKSNATHVSITCADGFYETVALDLINNDPTVILGYWWSGKPLPVRNGFPIRIHIPGCFGMKQPKWITGMELVEGDRDGYWVERGWSKDAFVKATSVIDTVATGSIITSGDQKLVPIGGIAWAGDRGISKVEVQTDGGEWVEAQLRAPLDNNLKEYRTWRIWRYDWPFSAGQHSFAVRCTEADGTMQVADNADVFPDGATGIDRRSASI